jgi:mRNA interferase YafQ
MRTVRYTSRFRRDYRREKSGRHRRRLDADLLATVTMLAKDEPLPRRYFDHPLGDSGVITAIATSDPTSS